MLTRHGLPGKLDTAPQGTKLKVSSGDNFDIYIQHSANEEEPNWIFVGTFNDESYKFYLSNHEDELTTTE